MKKVKFSPGFFSGITLILDGDYVKYVNGAKLSEQGSVPIKSIKSVTVEPVSNKDTAVKFIGEGTSLGYFTTGISYAQKCQMWLTEQLNF